MSKQSHYDFGLRALKTLLVSSGGLKRKSIMDSHDIRAQKDIDIFSSMYLGECLLWLRSYKMGDEKLKETLDEYASGTTILLQMAGSKRFLN